MIDRLKPPPRSSHRSLRQLPACTSSHSRSFTDGMLAKPRVGWDLWESPYLSGVLLEIWPRSGFRYPAYGPNTDFPSRLQGGIP